jgi:hypothetical protein
VAPSRRQQTGECDLLLFPISAYRINSCMKEKATANVLYELETALHKNEVRSSPQAVAALLADDFIEFGSSGRIFTKAAIIEVLKNESVDQLIHVERFQVRELSPEIALVTYLASRADPYGSISVRALRSSLWKREEGGWRMIFHQGTRIPD